MRTIADARPRAFPVMVNLQADDTHFVKNILNLSDISSCFTIIEVVELILPFVRFIFCSMIGNSGSNFGNLP